MVPLSRFVHLMIGLRTGTAVPLTESNNGNAGRGGSNGDPLTLGPSQKMGRIPFLGIAPQPRFVL